MPETLDESTSNYKIAFIHPDLGIGGAERLIVDVAMALQSADNNITIYTSHCDRTHCFEEIKSNQLSVKVYGDFLPTNFKGKFKIIFAFLRQLYLTLKLIITLQIFEYDIIILDQLSYCIPLIHLFTWNTKILFYCHFPDKLLASHKSLIRSVYRFLFDLTEEVSTSYADKIVVNSNFTKSIVYKTFKLLKSKNLDVIYPCVSTDEDTFKPSIESLQYLDLLLNENSFFLSINRFERKKNIELAINSYYKYIESTNDNLQSIVISGGYDPRVSENFEYLEELKELCTNLKLDYQVVDGSESKLVKDFTKTPKVLFLTSVSTDLKNALISKCDLLLYTPTNEHFGIVPLEAMRMGKLVLADNSGGPLETIVNFFDNKDEFTGFTVDSNVDKWKDVLEWVKSLNDDELSEISKRTKIHVAKNFSFITLKHRLIKVINDMQHQSNSFALFTHISVPLISYFIIKYCYNYAFN
jgi:alpha-1,3/alpha-1,6-mannosyltransferase